MNLIEQLRRDEGERLTAYECSEGYLTLGVGRLIDSRRGGGITAEESAYLLNNDIDRITAALHERLPWIADLDEARQGVLQNMAFQLGVEGLLGFRNTLRYIKEGRYMTASTGMLASKWALQTPARAMRLARQMHLGLWT